MTPSGTSSFGYKGVWAKIDLTGRTVRVEAADPAVYRDYVGGRGVQARLIHEHLRKTGPLKDPLSPANRIVIGSAALNDTAVPTAGRGSCSFVSPMTVSVGPAPWIPGHIPVTGMLTHSSAGGLFPNMLKRAGIDHLIIDGRADKPVRILVADGKVEILAAEDELFETVDGRKVARTASAITDFLTRKYPGSSTMCLGPAGWNLVAYACLTGDHHRNFGRGGAGAVFGSKNLVAITASGREATAYHDPGKFAALAKEIDTLVKTHVADPKWTASFRPTTGTTWWLDRTFNGKYLGRQGGYLPWHNFDEGWFPPEDQAKVGTDAFLAS
jgi:aldehyde:ferredoxin oxidoreductase